MDEQESLLSSDSICLGDVEIACAQSGEYLLIGTDEAGRGPLAGPVYAASVAIQLPTRRPSELDSFRDDLIESVSFSPKLDDSKKLTPATREKLFERIREDALAWSIAFADHQEIDEINILEASRRAMLESVDDVVDSLEGSPDRILVDGNVELETDSTQSAIVKGDARSLAIAAASVLAKVKRDAVMKSYHEEWPTYNFASNKGYPTREHRNALAEHGPSPIHRKSFSKVPDPEGPNQEELEL